MFLDTAIVVKLLVKEVDSEFFQTALTDQRLSASELALTETWSTLLSKERQKEITTAQGIAPPSELNRRPVLRDLVALQGSDARN